MTALRHVIAGYARQAQLSIRPALKFDSHYTATQATARPQPSALRHLKPFAASGSELQ
jgi:hypothetical protein